ncbi:succinate dehydrogenase assembly factor 3, mitochondrial [Uranotaenia lowii]|uniref:succinate dehydrogenase assembly factor 3, mitochondrial n=1 Tax=Uranotaenia lowii TaxID=190385 RepID=UPI002479F2AD|nr:succinate dehydrogenase assembly factor 3, mitochondrial [Uranotaenia lowii]
MSSTHLQRVRVLYKTILRLHRGLPEALQPLGNQYVRDEFRRHKTCGEPEAKLFMHEWTDYAIQLANQLGLKGKPKTIDTLGNDIDTAKLGDFRDEQVVQLYELLLATKGLNEEEQVTQNEKNEK